METETAKITTFSTEPENSSKPTPTKKSSVLSKIKKLFVSPQKPQNYCKEQTKFVLKAKKRPNAGISSGSYVSNGNGDYTSSTNGHGHIECYHMDDASASHCDTNGCSEGCSAD